MTSPQLKSIQDLLTHTLGFCNACLQRKDYASARRALDGAVALAPDNAVVLFHRAQFSLFLKDADAATRDLNAALKLDPGYAPGWSALARSLWMNRDAQGAEVAADRALAADPADEVARQIKKEVCAEREVISVTQAGACSERRRGCPGLVVIEEKGFRRQPLLIESVQDWGRLRGVPIVVIDHADFHAGRWGMRPEQVGAFYLPITEHYEPLACIPRQYRTIIDFDANGSSNISSIDVSGLRYAVRNAFGMRVAASHPPEFQVPYLHRPMPMRTAEVRDVIIFDVKTFHGMPAQAAVLTLIAGIAEEYPRICRAAGRPLYLYFSSFMPASVFMEAIDAFVREPAVSKITRNCLRDIAEFIIPPVPEMSQYKDILGRCRLFITEHGDLADIDIVQIGCMGVPILLYQRLPFYGTAGISLQTLSGAEAMDSRMPALLNHAENLRVRPEFGIERIFTHDRTEPWNSSVLEQMYMKSWDLLWAWALDGTVDQRVNQAMDTDFYWRLGLIETANLNDKL